MVLSQVPEFGLYDYICESLRWLACSLLISGSLEILCQRWNYSHKENSSSGVE